MYTVQKTSLTWLKTNIEWIGSFSSKKVNYVYSNVCSCVDICAFPQVKEMYDENGMEIDFIQETDSLFLNWTGVFIDTSGILLKYNVFLSTTPTGDVFDLSQLLTFSSMLLYYIICWIVQHVWIHDTQNTTLRVNNDCSWS